MALPPLLISAPPRKGKTAIALAHVWFARRMGFAVQYGVAPNTYLVSQELHGLMVRLGWWNNPAILGDCLNGSDVQGVKARAFDEALQRKRYDVVLFSSDNNNHAKATAADIEPRAVKLTARTAPEDERHGADDDGLRGEVDEEARANGCTDVFVLIRDEAQTNARFGAEEDEDKLAVAENKLAREQAARAVAERAPDAEQLLPGIRQRIAALEKAVELKQKAFDRKLASSQELLRPTFVTSKGFQILVSATLLPTLQERQLWGTLLEEELPEELDVGQDRFALPALGPRGTSSTWARSAPTTPSTAAATCPSWCASGPSGCSRTASAARSRSTARTFATPSARVTRLETEEGRHPDDPEYQTAAALKARLDALLTASKTELREPTSASRPTRTSSSSGRSLPTSGCSCSTAAPSSARRWTPRARRWRRARPRPSSRPSRRPRGAWRGSTPTLASAAARSTA